jgi:hypothetical protein
MIEGGVFMKRTQSWRFLQAPKPVREALAGYENAEWAVLVPKELKGPDIDKSFSGVLAKTEMANGDVVYAGNTKVIQKVA